MTEPAHALGRTKAQYTGLRMTADEFLRLPEDGYSYELVQGVVVMSRSPTPRHQAVTMEIATQIAFHLRAHPGGHVLAETDVHLASVEGGDLVYRPELVFLSAEHWQRTGDRIVGAPDLVVEVVSRGSRRFDSETKKGDYERFGVLEYWLVDPERRTIAFFRLEGGRFEDIPTSDDRFTSRAVPGFVLDLTRVRALF